MSMLMQFFGCHVDVVNSFMFSSVCIIKLSSCYCQIMVDLDNFSEKQELSGNTGMRWPGQC